jgi:Flp pilus assembly protein CpaB
MRLNMKTNLKVALSVIALAALVAAPAVAKSRTQERANTQAPAYQNEQVIVDGKVIGADPDAHIRGEIRRDGLSYRY